MTDTYTVKEQYRVVLQAGAEALIQEQINNLDIDREPSEILTELLSEVMNDYHYTTATGKHDSVWVYLLQRPEQHTEGWYNIRQLPEGWEGTDEAMAKYIAFRNKGKRGLLRLCIKATTVNETWNWEGE